MSGPHIAVVEAKKVVWSYGASLTFNIFYSYMSQALKEQLVFFIILFLLYYTFYYIILYYIILYYPIQYLYLYVVLIQEEEKLERKKTA